MTNLLSIKQNELLIKVFTPFGKKYNISLDDFTNKLVHKNSFSLNNKDLNFLLKRTNNIIDWSDSFACIDISFKNLQYLIKEETDEYIIGTQLNKGEKLEIISFKNLMVLDYDDMTLEEIENILNKSELTFLIYQTKRGFHAYCISKEFKYNDRKTWNEMNKYKCDEYYISFTKHVGFVTRLQKKNNREEEFIEKFIKQIPETGEFIDKLKKLVEFKDSRLLT
jgi:hypothetical protein